MMDIENKVDQLRAVLLESTNWHPREWRPMGALLDAIEQDQAELQDRLRAADQELALRAEYNEALSKVGAERDQLRAELEAAKGQDPVAIVERNATGQITMKSAGGGYFDISKYVGASFYAIPPIAAGEVPEVIRHLMEGWVAEELDKIYAGDYPPDAKRAAYTVTKHLRDLVNGKPYEYATKPLQSHPEPKQEDSGGLILGEGYELGLWSRRNAEAMIEDGNVINPRKDFGVIEINKNDIWSYDDTEILRLSDLKYCIENQGYKINITED